MLLNKKFINDVDNFIITNIHDSIKNNPKEWVKKNFNYSKSVMNSLMANLFDQNFNLNSNYLVNCFFIPKRKYLNPDILNNILNLIPKDILVATPSIINLSDIFLDHYFKEYTDEDIYSLYKHPFGFYDFDQIFEYSKKLPKLKNFSEIKDFISTKIINNPNLIQLDNQTIDDLTFELLKNKYDYNLAARLFKNCLNYCFYDIVEDIICVYEGNIPLMVVSVGEGFKVNINEIRGPRNFPVDKDIVKKVEKIIKNVSK